MKVLIASMDYIFFLDLLPLFPSLFIFRFISLFDTHTLFLFSSLLLLFEGLFPVFIDNERGMFQSNQITYGGLSDSFYEYLLKNWIIRLGQSV
jgi:hypothetical protein